MKKTKYKITGMHCNSCSSLIENTLKEQAGVQMAKVNHESGKAVVVYDDSKITTLKIIDLINQAGDYEATEEVDPEKSQPASSQSELRTDESQQTKTTGLSNKIHPRTVFLIGLIIGVGGFSLLALIILLIIR